MSHTASQFLVLLLLSNNLTIWLTLGTSSYNFKKQIRVKTFNLLLLNNNFCSIFLSINFTEVEYSTTLLSPHREAKGCNLKNLDIIHIKDTLEAFNDFKNKQQKYIK